MQNRLTDKEILLLDGGIGRELRFRGVELPETIWAAGSLLSDPDVVRQVHLDYIRAGADIITTNTYGVIRSDLAREQLEDRFAELNILACRLALKAREKADRKVLIAGSLPPLRGSYRPDLVGQVEEILPLYTEQAQILAPYVDMFLCETMSCGREGYAAAKAACSTGKPVWVAWTLHEDRSGKLRSGESVQEAVHALSGLAISGYLANCCAVQSITRFLSQIAGADVPWIGGYANTFTPIPQNWTLGGKQETDGLLTLDSELDPASYCRHVRDWLAAGANVVGGCCGTRPAHTAAMRDLLDSVRPEATTSSPQ